MLQSTTKYCVSRCKVQGNEQQFWRSHVGTSAIVTSSPPKSPIPPAAYPLFGFIALVTRFGSLLTFLLRLRCRDAIANFPRLLLSFHSTPSATDGQTDVADISTKPLGFGCLPPVFRANCEPHFVTMDASHSHGQNCWKLL